MIDATRVWQYLEDHADELLHSNDELLREVDRLRNSAKIALGREADDLGTQLEWPSGKHGAYPTSEWSPGMDNWLPFHTELSPDASRREWSQWAEKALTGVTTLAVDGSQIYPSNDWSIPVAAVQVGTFENPHLGMGEYKRSTKFEPISPLDLLGNDPDDVTLQDAVNERRHCLEIETLIDWMRVSQAEESPYSTEAWWFHSRRICVPDT